MNGDGFAELAVVRASVTGGAVADVSVQIYSGGLIPAAQAALDVADTGDEPGIYRLHAATDINGDGFADLYFQRGGVTGSQASADEILLGGNPLSLDSSSRISRPRSDSARVVAICDLDSDGYSDLIRDPLPGKLQVIYGQGRDGQTSGLLRESTVAIAGGYGILLCASNFTGSGDANLLLSSTDVPPVDGGRFRVVAKPLSPLRSTVCDGNLPQVSGGVGETDVAEAVGDVDGDGYDDVLIGDAYADHATRNRAVLFFGGCPSQRVIALPGGTSRVMSGSGLLGVTSFPSAGSSVAGTGDIDGDGFPDVAVGNPYRTGEGFGAGEVYLYRGGLDFDAMPTRTLVHPDNAAGSLADGFGASID